jgi:hypothetical protein
MIKRNLFEAFIALALVAAILIAFTEPADADTCAKVMGGKIVTIEAGKSHENCLSSEKGKDGNPIWRPYVKDTRPSHDPASQHPPQSATVIGRDRVTLTWSAPADMTQAELDARKAEDNDFVANGINKAVFEALCRLENHDRVSDGLTKWSRDKCRSEFRKLMP